MAHEGHEAKVHKRQANQFGDEPAITFEDGDLVVGRRRCQRHVHSIVLVEGVFFVSWKVTHHGG